MFDMVLCLSCCKIPALGSYLNDLLWEDKVQKGRSERTCDFVINGSP